MTSFMCILSIFLALMSTVHCIKCKQCWNPNSKECCGNTFVDCPRSCITYSENYTIDGKSLQSIRSGCEYNSMLESLACNKFLSIKTGAGVEVAVTAKCCYTDLCNENQQYENSQIDSSVEPIYKCPSCFNASSTEECVSSTFVTCNPDEGECVNYIGLIQRADASVIEMSVKGCITKGGCDIGFAVLPGTRELKYKQMKCTAPLPI
ncbi:hypothetical protein FKM82_013002 [Ascaphus truei]